LNDLVVQVRALSSSSRLEGMKYDDIARELEISANTVGTLLGYHVWNVCSTVARASSLCIAFHDKKL
jgi:hypothetical protein